MDTFLPQGFEPNRTRAQRSRPARARKLRVEVAGVQFPVLRRWAAGFAVAAENAPVFRGAVDLYDGTTHLQSCLILRHEHVDCEVIYSVKRAARVHYEAAQEF